MARQRASDAKILLERAGYHVLYPVNKKFLISTTDDLADVVASLDCDSLSVDRPEVVKLLDAKGFNAQGYKRRSAGDV